MGSSCVSKCGDGIVVSGELCDDNNTRSGDGCSSTCAVETGYTCSGNKPSRCNPNGPFCGDNQVNRAGEQCDKGPNGGQGCTATCVAQNGFTCNNNVCTANPVNNNRLTLVGSPIINYNNVFVTLQTQRAFVFANEVEMSSFMKYQFPNPSTIPSSVFCSQSLGNQRNFECLLLYASGLPNGRYDVNFSYNFQGESGFLTVAVNPSASSFQTRSLS